MNRPFIHSVIAVLAVIFFSLGLSAQTTTSVLSSGDWYKLSIGSDGLYKIDYNFLSSLGINVASINPQEIKIYGNGGGMLPQANSAGRYDDLVENAILVVGESDNSFDPGDYILFYGKGPDTWAYNSSEAIFNHTKNIYSDYAFYFLTYGSGNGKRVADKANIGGAVQTITTFNDYAFYEKELTSIIQSGREWYGESFDFTTSRTFNFNLTGLQNNSDIKITSAVMASANVLTSFSLSANGVGVGSQSIAAMGSGTYDAKGVNKRDIITVNAASLSNNPNINLSLTYNKGGSSSSTGYLNYLEFNYMKNLALYGTQTHFRSIASTSMSPSQFVVNNTNASSVIWEITNPRNPYNQLFSLSGSQSSFTTVTDTIREFIVFTGNNFPTPTFITKVVNQNLHGIQAPNLPDMIIVTPPEFKSEAQRLANFRLSNDNLNCIVATTDEVYNEFSSGAQDITAIRDFVRLLYNRKTATDSIRYLLLFGDASYDYKNRIAGNTNKVPIYESRESLDPLKTFSSEDYYGFMDITEGTWGELPAQNHTIDIGIGRLPAKNLTEATALVNKIIHYHSAQTALGKWRKKITFVADDGDGNLHQNDAEDLSKKVDTTYKKLNVNKIYLDAYPQESAPGGEKSPVVKQLISDEIDRGTFIMNYSGHGGELGWTQESILDVPQINSWTNYDKLPFMITATCEFGRYDDPAKPGGAEYTLLNSNGGSIGLFTSTRPVYQFSNKALNEQIYNYMFTKINNEYPRLGDIYRLAKNSSISGVNNRNYTILGDPGMMLEYPEDEVVITQFNGVNVTVSPDTLKALSKIIINGEIRDEIGTKLSDFNGTVNITIFDKASTYNTLGTAASPMSFKLRNNIIYEGLSSVVNGDFTTTFIVPKDISYILGKGKISLYAQRNNSTVDAGGYYDNIIVGGSDPNIVLDNTPPVIELFMNDESFVFGGMTGVNPLFIAKVSDENGINITGTGIGHDLTSVMNNSNEVLVLNDYYTSNLDSYQSGTVKYNYKNLPAGNHSIKFKAWDTHNNSSEAYLEFIVANDEKIALQHVLNYPNPFSTNTEFHFDHNRSGDDLDVMIQVFTISGKLIKTLEGSFMSSSSHLSGLNWDGRDDFGDKIGKGVYVYKVKVRSLRDGSSHFMYQKLVMLN